jgi:hypothetical protein
MRRILISCSFAIICLIASCATTPPTSEELSKIGYGEPLTIDYKAVINSYFEQSLIDPFSAHIKYGEPKEYWVKASRLEGGGLTAGYGVPVQVNAKNRMGGYVGWKDYIFIFRNNQLVKILHPEDLYLMRTR